MEAILPVAEETNVLLVLHPDDSPVESLTGILRLFRNFEGFNEGWRLMVVLCTD